MQMQHTLLYFPLGDMLDGWHDVIVDKKRSLVMEGNK
jgi:hypothetical protein